MKFGGTSVGDASCIGRVVSIIRGFSQDNALVVVVSAMKGVTNELIEAAFKAQSGDLHAIHEIFESIRSRHFVAADALLPSCPTRTNLKFKFQQILDEGERLCQDPAVLHESDPRFQDALSGLGERLSAHLVAAALEECGILSQTIEASQIIVTDSFHGSAEPIARPTRERCESLIRPLLHEGKIPVVTGFIGATQDGVPTTLGRGGSDYSATILGAALEADEVIIWTDVNGVLTADPRHVSDAMTIPEISYSEASELAYFGAKVLHPKTLRPVVQSEIPVCIRNTFQPDHAGTRITSAAPPTEQGVRAITALTDVALITLSGPWITRTRDVLGRTFSTASAVRADVLLISQASSRHDLCFVVPSALAKRAVDALCLEFAQDLHQEMAPVTVNEDIAIIAIVGEKLHAIPGLAGRIFTALGRESVNVMAIAQGSSDSNISFMVLRNDLQKALRSAHQEFELHAPNLLAIPSKTSHLREVCDL